MSTQSLENIGIFCPSDTSANLEPPFVERGIANLQLAGYEPLFSEGVGPTTADLRLAGTEQQRAAWLHEMLDDTNIHGVMSFWGGFNTASMLGRLDLDGVVSGDKPVIGYSDSTSLLLALYSRGFEHSYYGPAFISFAKVQYEAYTGDSLNAALSGSDYSYRHPRTERTLATPLVMHPGSALGRAIAGNLDTLLSLNATAYAPDYEDVVLFIEDAEYVNSRRFYRHMTQLEQSGITQKVAALCIGAFTASSGIEQAALDEIVSLTVPSSTPVISNLAFGHGDPVFTIPIGRNVALDFDMDHYDIVFSGKAPQEG